MVVPPNGAYRTGCTALCPTSPILFTMGIAPIPLMYDVFSLRKKVERFLNNGCFYDLNVSFNCDVVRYQPRL